jgi:hypothetical protein
MKYSRPTVVFVSFAAVGLLFTYIGHARKSSAQEADKSLDIERYANEPLELVDLKVSEQSIKSKIKVKHRNGDQGREGLDKVEFQDQHDWFKRVRIRLRNVSGKPIVALQAYLYFKPTPAQDRFSVSLVSSKRLGLGGAALGPGDEIELTVNEQSWSMTASILRQYGVDANLGSVTLSEDIVAFSDDLQWSKGHLLHRDPNTPNRWIPIDTASPAGSSRLKAPAQFTSVAFRPNATPLAGSFGKSWMNSFTPEPPQVLYTCKIDSGYDATGCCFCSG